MLAALIEVQVFDELLTKTGLRKHAPYGHPHKFGRLLCQNLLRSRESLSARITGVTYIDPVGHLLAGELHLVRIEDDDVVATILVRSEG